MVIAKNGHRILPIERHLEQFEHIVFDRLGVRFAELRFEYFTAPFLEFCHTPLSAQLTVSEMNKEVRALLHGYVMVHRVILAVFERLESVNHDLCYRRAMLHELVMKQHAVTAKTSDMAIDSLGTDIDITGNLATGHASDGFHEDELVEIRALLPVRSGKSLGAEGAIAGLAYKPLDTSWRELSTEGANLFIAPTRGYIVVVLTITIGTMRWNEG
ncbi:MAG: hypothetical protein ACI9UQ_001843 [Candidatus Krumholzibacteriia bacterium]|jgi:hypothetical protein